jgi:hypothetical protein
MICLLAFPVTFWHCAREFVGIWEDDLFSRPCLDQAVMYRLGHWSGPWVFALDYVLSCGFLKGPDYWLWGWALQFVWHRRDSIAVHWYDDEMMLLLGLLRYRQAEDLIDVFPRNGKFDVAIGAYGSYAAVFLV